MIPAISYADLEFERVPVEFLSSRGVPQTRLQRVGVPHIPQRMINGIFYLYKSVEDARLGRYPGGTGFIVGYDGTFREDVPGLHFYGVTNWHVAVRDGFSVLRLNTKNGEPDIFDLGPQDWEFLPQKYDVAVTPLNLDEKIHDVMFVSTQWFLDRSDKTVGIGEDVFMLGLFIDHDGGAKNVPSARFGHISMMANSEAPVEQPNRYKGESFVVDMHSRSGFSGSPVYVYRTHGTDLSSSWKGHEIELIRVHQVQGARGRIRAHMRYLENDLFRLLGIHWGQFPEEWRSADGTNITGLSGMTCVIPAWHILEVLEMPKLRAQRHPGIVAAMEKRKRQPMAESSQTTPSPESANPSHREDFNSLLNAAARKKSQDD